MKARVRPLHPACQQSCAVKWYRAQCACAPPPPPSLLRSGSVRYLTARRKTCTQLSLGHITSTDKEPRRSGRLGVSLDTEQLSSCASCYTRRHGALLIPAGRLEEHGHSSLVSSWICLDIWRPDHVCEGEGDPDQRQCQPAALFLFCRGGFIRLHASHLEPLCSCDIQCRFSLYHLRTIG